MADALGVALLDGLANVERQVLRRDHAGRELASVQRDVHLRIEAVQIIEHVHLQAVIAQGDIAVFRLNVVQADDVGVLRRNFEGEEGLRKDLLGRVTAQHLIEKADRDLAGRCGIRLAAVLHALATGERGVERLAAAGDAGAKDRIGEELLAELREIGIPAQFVRFGFDAGIIPRLHQLQILFILRGGMRGDLIDPRGFETIVVAEAPEGVEEVVVAGVASGGDEGAHGEGVDQLVVEVLIGEDAGGGSFAGGAVGRVVIGVEAETRGAHALIVLGRFVNPGFRVNGAGEVHVQIGPFGHPVEERVERGRALPARLKERTSGPRFRRGGLREERGCAKAESENQQEEREAGAARASWKPRFPGHRENRWTSVTRAVARDDEESGRRNLLCYTG